MALALTLAYKKPDLPDTIPSECVIYAETIKLIENRIANRYERMPNGGKKDHLITNFEGLRLCLERRSTKRGS